MPARIKALLLLAWALVRLLLRKVVRAPGGLELFRANYDADGLPPVTAEERRLMPAFSRCIACGLCDRGEAERVERSRGAYQGVMTLVLAGSRSMPDFRVAMHGFRWVPQGVLEEKAALCPTGVPFVALAAFVQRKALDAGVLEDSALPAQARP